MVRVSFSLSLHEIGAEVQAFCVMNFFRIDHFATQSSHIIHLHMLRLISHGKVVPHTDRFKSINKAIPRNLYWYKSQNIVLMLFKFDNSHLPCLGSTLFNQLRPLVFVSFNCFRKCHVQRARTPHAPEKQNTMNQTLLNHNRRSYYTALGTDLPTSKLKLNYNKWRRNDRSLAIQIKSKFEITLLQLMRCVFRAGHTHHTIQIPTPWTKNSSQASQMK